jgi:hypothetical protein
VFALTTFDDGLGAQLCAAGQFTTAGGIPARNVARWNGTSWSACATTMTTTSPSGATSVGALASFDDGTGNALYVGGHIVSAGGGVFASNIAKWNGTTWSALGSGADDFVEDLYVFDDGSGEALYASGAFSNMGGVPGTNAIARWKHGAWSAVGGGMNAEVMTMFGFDDGTGPALFAGGYFTTAGGVPAARVARWNGTSWSALGAGIGPTSVSVRAFAAFDDGQSGGPDLYVGGDFESAGGVSAHRVAQWRGCRGLSTPVCSGDGTSAACPCANTGMPGHGCQNSASTGGSLVYATGTTTPDTIVLSAFGELPSVLSIFLQGNAVQSPPAIFGDGLRCAGGSLKRLYTKHAVAGVVTAPEVGDPSISARSAALGDVIPPGGQRIHQVYYRDSDLGFCPDPPGNRWNVSNGIRIQW